MDWKVGGRWFLSVDEYELHQATGEKKAPSYGSITIDGQEVEFSGGFTYLHTLVDQEILSGGGYRLQDVRPSIKTVSKLKNPKVNGIPPDRADPFLRKRRIWHAQNAFSAALLHQASSTQSG